MTTESHEKVKFKFIANCQTVSQNGSIILHSHEESMRGLAAQHYFSHSDRHLLLVANPALGRAEQFHVV